MLSWLRVVGAVCLLLIISTSAMASTPAAYEPVFKPSLTISKTSANVDIDGELNESLWNDAKVIENFVERSPGDNLPTKRKTYAMVTYDKDNLYVAFRCFDDPSQIRATMCQRDQFHGDDAVAVLLDTYGDATWAYQFYVNPYGIQKDLLWTNTTGGDTGFDLIWKSAAKITSDGYQVEMAIPFSSLRFPNNDVQNWRMDLYRNLPRESYYTYSWAANDRDEQCWPCQWGTVNGIEDVSPGKGYEILPTFIANQTGALASVDENGSLFENEDIDGELSLNGKFRLSSNATIEGTINPDFSQIESDASQIDVNTTIALFYPERRPFFQEGADIFRTLFNSFYTRTVNDPQYAGKMTGRYNGFTIGVISALDENSPYMIPLEEHSLLINTDKSYVNAIRGTKQLGQSSSLGFIVTDRRWENDGSGSILAFDHRLRITRNLSFNGQYIWSHTVERNDSVQSAMLLDQAAMFGLGSTFNSGKHTIAFDGEKYWGNAFISQLRYNSRSIFWGVGLDQVNPSYRTETGYDPVNNDRNINLWGGYTFRPEKSIVERVTPQFNTYRRFNYDGTKKISNYNVGLNVNLRKAQTYFGLNYYNGFERFDSTDFDDLWNIDLDWQSRFSDKFATGLSYERGVGYDRWSKRKSNDISVFYWFDFKPIDRLLIEPNISYYTADDKETGTELYDGFITRTRIQLQANKELSIRLIAEYNDFRESWSIDPLLTYRISSFSVFYVGSSYNYRNFTVGPQDKKVNELTNRTFFMKLQYLFQI